MKKSISFFANLFLFISFVVLGSPVLLADQGPTISAEEFVASPAGQALQDGDYEKALRELDGLKERYPADSLIARYRGIALDNLGRSEEAISIFQDLLLEDTEHLPTRYFLAQAYARSGQYKKAEAEWKQIAREGEGTPYGAWSRAALVQTTEATAPAKRRKVLPWQVTARYGYEYDSNVILKPNDKSIASTRDQNAGRQTFDLGVRYRAYSRRDAALDFLYAVRQTIHDDSLNEFNFHSETFGVHGRKRVQIGDQDVVLGARYELLLGFLDDSLFSTRNRWHLSADTRFTPRTRTLFYDRMTVSNFGPDGSIPSRTSRDGFYNDVGVTHYWYASSDFRTYLFARQEFNSSHTRGDNFDTVGTTSRLGFHHPLMERLDLDASTGLKLGFYHNFSSISSRDRSRRRDIQWDIYAALTYRLTPSLGLRGFYRYISNDNQNNIFDYNRQIGGVQIIYRNNF